MIYDNSNDIDNFDWEFDGDFDISDWEFDLDDTVYVITY